MLTAKKILAREARRKQRREKADQRRMTRIVKKLLRVRARGIHAITMNSKLAMQVYEYWRYDGFFCDKLFELGIELSEDKEKNIIKIKI